jgi:hypothetical protein
MAIFVQKSAVSLAVIAALLAASVNQSFSAVSSVNPHASFTTDEVQGVGFNAFGFAESNDSIPPNNGPCPLPPPTPVYPSSTVAFSTGAAITFGFIGFVAALCMYDVWLKYMGYKNWDGTAKVAQVHHHQH